MISDAALAPVPMWRLFLRMGGWFVLGLGAVLLVLALVGQQFFAAAKRFEAEGRHAPALVTEKYITESTDSDGDKSITRWLDLEFTTREGERIAITKSVGTGEYHRAVKGQEIDLWYLESAPSRVEITRGSNARGAGIVQIVLLALGAGWLGLLWMVGRWVVEALRARRYGAREEARVTEVHRTSVRVNNRPRYRLKWRDGQGREGQSLMRRIDELEGYRPGDPVRIYHGLKRSWWAGDIGDRAGPD
ncbi:MAG: DUF3592 domain-containing protein [Roseovarius sp.]|nr:DUF3592 domain-containing protein [Roseovarius sp.]